ncbi:MAG: putative transposase [Verrucomicrobiales bacterium]|jgi:putative transposase
MNRGACHKTVFDSRYDRIRFLALIGEATRRYSIEVHAYCLMGNHFHLLVRTPDEKLDEAMQFLSGQYTQFYNRRYGRDGALFRGRYRSLLVDDERYLLAVSRYIHRNPTVFLGADFADYRWSSYAAFLGELKPESWLFLQETLEIGNGIDQYRVLVEASLRTDVDLIYDCDVWPETISDGLFDLHRS